MISTNNSVGGVALGIPDNSHAQRWALSASSADDETISHESAKQI